MSRGLRLLLLALLPLLLTGCSSLLFFPDRTLRQHPTVERFHPEDRTFTSGDETLHGWFFAAEKPVASILVLHGNAENLTSHIHSTLWLVKEGFNLFIVDYRGYGQSSGSPDLAGAHNDAAAALEALNRFPESADMPLIVLGQSIGAAIAVKTVATTPFKERLAALVLDSPFFSYRRIAQEKIAALWLTWPLQWPLAYLFNDDTSPNRWIDQVAPLPILFVHDANDAVIPIQHTFDLFDLADNPKELFLTRGIGHIAAFADAQLRQQLTASLQRQITVWQKLTSTTN